jgi:hypothetical protein
MKVRAVCPLCKGIFKSIIHNVRSDSDYDKVGERREKKFTFDSEHLWAIAYNYISTKAQLLCFLSSENMKNAESGKLKLIDALCF